MQTVSPLQALESATATCSQVLTRYYKVNVRSYIKHGTVEFRQHGGSLNRHKIANWIKFLLQFVEASKPSETTEATETISASTPIQTNRPLETGKSLMLIQALRTAPSYGITADALATQLASTKKSIQSMICRLRKRGWVIRTSRGFYKLIESTAPVQTPSQPTLTRDSLWAGIDESLRTYFNRRTQILSA